MDTTKDQPFPEDEQPDGYSEPMFSIPLDFGAERGRVLEHSEATSSDLAMLTAGHYAALLRNGLPRDVAAAFARDFHAQGAAAFWNG